MTETVGGVVILSALIALSTLRDKFFVTLAISIAMFGVTCLRYFQGSVSAIDVLQSVLLAWLVVDGHRGRNAT